MSLPDPIELCLEELDDDNDTPYVRCTAVAGGSPGLCFSQNGEVLWKLNAQALAELWVSMDRRLIFYRKRPHGRVSLTRAERHLELPLEKPVVVLDGDEINVEGKRFRIHFHGTAAVVSPPERLTLRRARNLAVGAALVGALTAGCRDIEVRLNPPVAVPAAFPDVTAPSATASGAPDAESAPTLDAAADGDADAGASDGGGAKAIKKTPPIKIRQRPPAPMPRPDLLEPKPPQ